MGKEDGEVRDTPYAKLRWAAKDNAYEHGWQPYVAAEKKQGG